MRGELGELGDLPLREGGLGGASRPVSAGLGRRPPALLKAQDPPKLLAACGGGPRGARDRLAVLLLWRALLRCQEACALQVEDLEDLPGGGFALRVQAPKGAARGAPRRRVGLDPRTEAFLAAWLALRPAATGLPRSSGAVLASSAGAPLQTSHLRRLLRRLGRAAGLGRVHPHALRHRGAADLYEERIGMREIQLLLGHRSLAVTSQYLGAIGATQAVAVSAARRWTP